MGCTSAHPKTTLQAAITDAFTNASSGDVVFLYIIGHGGQSTDASESGELNGADEYVRLQFGDEPRCRADRR